MTREKRFDQKYDDIKIVEIPIPEEIFLPVYEFTGHKKLLEGIGINEYEEIVPGIHAPVNGEIKESSRIPVNGIESDVVRISVSDPGEIPEPENLSDLPTEVILKRLEKTGLDISPESVKENEIIVSAVETDPLCAVFQQLVRENLDNLNECFSTLQLVLNKDNIYFAVPENIFDLVWELQTSGVTIHKVSPFYPGGLPELLINSMSDKYKLKSPVCITIEEVINALEVIKTDKPCVNKVLTLTDKNGTSNLKVKKGTPLKEILKNSDIRKIKKVIIGGPLRGFANYDLNSPVTDQTGSIYVQYKDDVIRAVNNQCINCGRCNNICPASLIVNLICRYSEFSIFEKCSDMNVENCIECGLCSFYCPAGRSLLQLIRLAKNEIKQLEGEAES